MFLLTITLTEYLKHVVWTSTRLAIPLLNIQYVRVYYEIAITQAV